MVVPGAHMSERIGNSFRGVVAAGLLVAAALLGFALLLLVRGSVLEGAILATVTYFLFKWFWRASRRKRELTRRGYYTGQRVGTNWVYEELHDGVVVSLEFPLEYVGRGAYDIHLPDEGAWVAVMPEWARPRRAEVLARVQSVFKFSQIRVDSDATAFRSANG
jgi:hypothetical protein